MKVRVNLLVVAKEREAPSCRRSLELEVGENETAGALKERIAEIEGVPFPEQSLRLGNDVLADGRPLSDCRVKDRDALDYVVQATSETLSAQLAQLLKLRDVSCDELGLMYSYKFGAGIGQALELLGRESSLQNFLVKQQSSGISVCNGVASLARDGIGLRTFSVAEEVEQLLRRSSSSSMEINDLCIRFANKFGVSLTSVAGVTPAAFFEREHALFTVPCPGYVCLKGKKFQLPRAAPTDAEEAPADCLDAGYPDLPPGLGFPPGLNAKAPAFEPSGAMCWAGLQPGCRWYGVGAVSGQGDEKYMELHEKICGRFSDENAAEALDRVVQVLQEAAFLNVDRVAVGGSLAKGTAISAPTGVDAEIVFFLRALPAKIQDRWMPPLIRAAAGTLAEKLQGEHGIEGIRATTDSVHLRVVPLRAESASPLVVDLRFSPAFDDYAEAAKALATVNSPDTRRFFSATFVEERVQFIANQPNEVKVTIRLLKWWRDQQNWSSKTTRPSDDLMELLSAYAAAHLKPTDQRTAVANVMSLCSRFGELRVVWSDVYDKADVWKPLMKQRPLLMDPANPYVNIADPQAFDARELIAAAKTTHFFW